MRRTKGSRDLIQRKNSEIENSHAGRPSKLYNEFGGIDLAYKLALLGLTDEEMANVFEVPVDTFLNWKELYPEFVQVLNDGKAKADARVTESLYKRAMGYSHPDTHFAVSRDKETGKVDVIQTAITKHYPPDVTACIFWLKNRQRKIWRDVQQKEVSGPDGKPLETKNSFELPDLNLSDLTDEELAALEKIGQKLSGGNHEKES